MTKVFKEIKTMGWAYFLLVFAAIFFSHDSLLFGTNSNQTFITIRKIVPFVLILSLLIYVLVRNIKIVSNKLFLCLTVFILPIISCLLNGEPMNNYIYRLSLMICSLLFVVINKKQFFNAFCIVMSFLTIWSLVFFAIVNLAPSITAFFPKITNTGGLTFYTSIFSTISMSPTYHIYRNEGIFREPGVFACFLMLAIIIELYFTSNPSKKRCVLYYIGILTTLSTAGLIIAFVLFVFSILSAPIVSSSQKKLFFLVLPLFLVFLIIIGQNVPILYSVFSKFEYGNNSFGSFYARYQSIFGNLRIAFNNPLFGIGRYALYDSIIAIDANNSNYVATDNTNTFLINFSAFGFLYGLICIYGAINFLRLSKKNNYVIALLFVLLFLILSNEDLGQNIVYFAIVFAGLLSNKKEFKTFVGINNVVSNLEYV